MELIKNLDFNLLLLGLIFIVFTVALFNVKKIAVKIIKIPAWINHILFSVFSIYFILLAIKLANQYPKNRLFYPILGLLIFQVIAYFVQAFRTHNKK